MPKPNFHLPRTKSSVRWTGWLLVLAVVFGLRPHLPAFTPISASQLCIAVEDVDGLWHWSEEVEGSNGGVQTNDSLELEGDEEEESHSKEGGPWAKSTAKDPFQAFFWISRAQCAPRAYEWVHRKHKTALPCFIAFRKLIL
jgi:hypothetical protein